MTSPTHTRKPITKAGLYDLAERAVTSFLHTGISVLLVGNATDLVNISLLQAAALAGVASALTTIQGYLGTRLNGGSSARIIKKPEPKTDEPKSPLL